MVELRTVAPAVVGSNPTAHPKLPKRSFAALRISAADSRSPLARRAHAMALLCLLRKLCQSREVQAESSSGQPRCDLLEQPAVAVGIAERGERAVAARLGRRAADAAVRRVREPSPRCSSEAINDRGTAAQPPRIRARQIPPKEGPASSRLPFVLRNPAAANACEPQCSGVPRRGR